MKGTITTRNETVYVGLRCDPRKCPKCGAGLVRFVIDINLVESTCACGYSARDRDGSLRDADDIRDAMPKLSIGRTA